MTPASASDWTVEELLFDLACCDAVSGDAPAKAFKELEIKGELAEGMGTGARAFVGRPSWDRDARLVAVRGSAGEGPLATRSNVLMDISAYRVAALDLAPKASVHAGFLWHAASILHPVLRLCRGAQRVHLTGFSLGGASAFLLGLYLHGAGVPEISVTMMGAPKPGDAALAEFGEQAIPTLRSVELAGDVIPSLPLRPGFRQPGHEIRLPPLPRRLAHFEHKRDAYRRALLGLHGGHDVRR